MTVLGCLLSVSGLYSLASLNIHRRTKEIGVRKVLGASIISILRLINYEFVLILLIAAILGGTGGYILTNGLLSDLYAQHIDVNILTVVLSGIIVLLIGMSATSLTIWTAANSNPIKALASD